MDRQITGRGPSFRPPQRRSNFYRVMLYLGLILTGVWVLLGIQRGQIEPLFLPTPTPTRIAESYIQEAEAYFAAGKLDDPSNNVKSTPTPLLAIPNPKVNATDAETTPTTPTPVPEINDAIEAYRAALDVDPQNAQVWAELARIQAYSSSTLRNDHERRDRLQAALESATKAVELAPDGSSAHAIRAFVLDWYASTPLVYEDEERSQELLNEANQEALVAFRLDPENALSLAYYAEILADQQKWAQARQYADQAVKQAPDLMDTHRVYGYVLEMYGEYNSAIQQYLEASHLAPNLTFLLIRIGQNYREGLWRGNPVDKSMALKALDYFDQAARINEQLGVQNAIPYLEIAQTYTQLGEFFSASLNAEKALSLDSNNAATYGQLGIIFQRARNYEGSMELLRCAVRGCTAEQNEMGGVAVEGLPLTNKTIAYYYVEYGTVLAFLSRPKENYCPEALPVLEEVRRTFPDDPTIIAIIEDSEGICRRLDSAPPGGTQIGGTTPTPSPTP